MTTRRHFPSRFSLALVPKELRRGGLRFVRAAGHGHFMGRGVVLHLGAGRALVIVTARRNEGRFIIAPSV